VSTQVSLTEYFQEGDPGTERFASAKDEMVAYRHYIAEKLKSFDIDPDAEDYESKSNMVLEQDPETKASCLVKIYWLLWDLEFTFNDLRRNRLNREIGRVEALYAMLEHKPHIRQGRAMLRTGIPADLAAVNSARKTEMRRRLADAARFLSESNLTGGALAGALATYLGVSRSTAYNYIKLARTK